MKLRTWSRIWIPIAAMKAIGKESMRPTMAATSPRSNVSGPMDTRLADVESVAMRMIASAERKPAMVHTPVDTILGLTPVKRARSGLATEARTDSPNFVWLSSHHSPTVVTGTAMSASSCAALMVTPLPSCHCPLNGVGKVVVKVPVR